MIKTIYYDALEEKLVILDQSLLPEKVYYHRYDNPEDIALAIKNLLLRGAPLIGVTAAYGIALAIKKYQANTTTTLEEYFDKTCKMFADTRPTAINLFWAIQRMRDVFEQKKHMELEELKVALIVEAQGILNEDIKRNLAIGRFGQELIKSESRIMTICNAGALATAGYGTALGVIRAIHENKQIINVWACETRPVLQGSRLTIWELIEDNIPVTLITDSMAAHVMSLGLVDAVIVGADRIASNGDTANKIGTYGLAIVAKEHGIPFYVAAPSSSFDLNISLGKEIPIEERDGEEIRQINGVYLTPPEVKVFNPAFDITPAKYISAIISEKGIIKPPYDLSFDIL